MKLFTGDEISVMYPGLELRVFENGFDVGYPEPGDLFNVQGTGSTTDEAWQDAYECLTNTGKYSKEIREKVFCKLSIDVTHDGDHWLYFYDDDRLIDSILITKIQATNISTFLKLAIGNFPF
jgi:hypothetical protein